MKLRSFATYHPWTICLYFIGIMVYTMMVNDPINMVIACVGSHILYASCCSRRQWFHHVVTSLVIIMIIACTNPLFVHQGVTILWYMNYNPITLEAFYYGLAFGSMIVSMLTLCRIMHQLMRSDKILYIFGSFLPTAGLLFSMILRLIPKFQKQMKQILQAQRTLGMDIHQGSIWKRIRICVTAFSMMITWAFEHGVECADSMKARGYGSHRRSHFSLYHIEKRDRILYVVLLLFLLLLGYGYLTFYSHMYYYPHVTPIPTTFMAILGYFAYGIYFLIPLWMEGRERIIWHYVRAQM